MPTEYQVCPWNLIFGTCVTMDFMPIAENAVVGAPDWFLSGAVATSRSYLQDNVRYALTAFSSKPYVHIFLVTIKKSAEQKDVCSLTYVGQIQAHHERISGLSFCTNPNFSSSSDIHLFSCGFDGLVRHWGYHDHEWLLNRELNVRELNDSLLPTSVDSTTLNEQVLALIGTNKGTLVVWCVFALSSEPVCLTKKFENDSVTTCAWEPFTSPIGIRLAVGYKKGVVGVYLYQPSSVTTASVMTQISRFYAHERDVCHVVWNPFAGDPNGEMQSRPDLLSTGRDQMVKLWNVSTSWCCASVKVPGSTRSIPKEADSSIGAKNQSTGAPWISASWFPTQPDKTGRDIVVSGLRGELYSWSESSQLIRLHTEDRGHSMLIFVIRSIVDSDGLFFTLGQDRQMVLWKHHGSTDLSFVLRVPIIASGVCALSQSDHGRGPVAVGVADGSILLWRCSSSTEEEGCTSNSIVSLWPRGMNSSSITALAWHPCARHESLLVYGTESGCVELIDTAKIPKNPTQKPKTQPYVFGSTVYRVAWGPPLFTDTGKQKVDDTDAPNTENELIDSASEIGDVEQKDQSSKSSNTHKFSFYVYSVCKGKIFCHVGFQRPPLDVTMKFPSTPGLASEEWANDKRTDISFLFLDSSNRFVDDPSEESKIPEHFSCLVTIGYRSGAVDVYGCINSKRIATENVIQPLCRVSCHTKGVNCLSWSFDRYWLAIGTNESYITVADIGYVLKQAIKPATQPFRQISTYLARLEGHCNRITCLDWSPHDRGLLLSASFDGTANVWRIEPTETGSGYTSIANFRAHRLRLFACLWSRQEADLAFSGGELCHLFSWRPSKLLHKEPPNSRRYRPPPVKRLLTDTKDSLPAPTVSSFSDVCLSLPEVNSTQQEADAAQHPQPEHSTESPIETNITPEPSSKASAKKSSAGDKRKRPSLCPHFLHRNSVEPSTTDLGFCPPFRLGSKFVQVLHVLNLLNNGVELPESDRDLLFLLPEMQTTRPALVRFLTGEAAHHLAAYRATQRANGLMHLDAHCILLLWLGRSPLVAQTMCSEKHMPFWLLWAVQLAQATTPAFATSLGCAGDHFELDLVGEKIKEMTSHSPDVLVSSTVLVCAGRHQEAVEYLLAQDRVKEALLLARLRLSPTDSKPIVQKCIARIIERRLCPEVPFAGAIHELGCGEWERAQTVLRQAAVLNSSRPGIEVEQVAGNWVELNILLNCPENNLTMNAFVRLALSCLIVGFQLPETEAILYFQQCQKAVTPSAVFTVGTDCFQLLLNTGLQFTAVLMGFLQPDIPLACELQSDPSVVVECLRHATLDRQPSNRWSTHASQLVVDFSICLLPVADPSSQSQFLEDLNRFETSLRSCMKLNSKTTIQLIGGLLLHSNGSLKLSAQVIQLLSTNLRASTTTDLPIQNNVTEI